MATVWRGSTPSPIWAPWSLITIPGLQTPWLSSRRHSSICTSWECSGKEHLREAAGDFLPLYHREHPNLPHHGVVLPLHWGRQEEATESGRDSTEDHRMAPLFPQRHLLILLTQQCWVNHKRQHPSRTSPVRPVTLWQALQVHQNQNKQTQKQLLSTSHHCTEHKRALTMTGTHASTPMHAHTHTHACTRAHTHHPRTMCSNCKSHCIVYKNTVHNYLFIFLTFLYFYLIFLLVLFTLFMLYEYLDAAKILLYTVQWQ